MVNAQMITRASGSTLWFDARIRSAVFLLICAVSFGCDKASLLAPINSTIQVTAATRILPPGGSTTIQAIVVENSGQPVPNGTTVRFTTSLGRLDPAESQTTNGIATTTFLAGNDSGIAQIRAVSGLANASGQNTTTTPGATPAPPAGGGAAAPATPTSSQTAGNVVEITIGAAAANTVAVSASPRTVPAGGGTVSIAAVVLDTSGNRLPNVPVVFSSTQGSLSSTTTTTDANGEARVELTTSQQSVVTVNAGSRSGTVTIAVAPPLGITLGVSSNPVAGQPMTLTVTPAANTAPRVTVDWGDGSSSQDLGIVATARTVNHTYATQGAFSIRSTATADGQTLTADAVAIVSALPGPQITFSPSNPRSDQDVVFTITPAPGVATTNVSIDFGDGTPAQDLGAITSPTTARHRYAPGTYTVRVTQTTAGGTSSVGSTVVTVTSP
jgi:hypothetical protein